MLTSLAQMRSQLQGLVGADVSDDEANSLLNEGYLKLVCESEWSRGTFSFEPGSEVALPDSVYKPLKVWVDGDLYAPTDKETVRRIESNELWLRSNGVWFIDYDENGNESIVIYPGPATDEIEVLAVVRPVPLVEDNDEPVACPPEFRRGIVEYAAAISLSGLEDDAEAHALHMSEFERYREGLRAFRNSRTGSGPRQIRVAGIHY